MNKLHLLALVACAALGPVSVMASDAPPPPPPGRPAPGEHFAALDKDGDGKLSRAEAKAAPRLSDGFDRIDANGDGFLVKDELRAAREKVRDEVRERAEEQFAASDRNADGQIDLGEAQAGMPRVAQKFQQLDRDGNGLLSKQELREGAITQRHERRPPEGPPVANPPQP
jgi:Ca2+-binding EF-hand superfamily protein